MGTSDSPATTHSDHAHMLTRCGRLIFAIVFATIAASCTHSQKSDALSCVPRTDMIDVRSLDVARDAPTRLAAAFESDQKDRLLPSQGELSEAEWNAIDVRDEARREEAANLITAKVKISPKDLYFASVVFLHGQCPDHYRLAAALAGKAMSGGESDARSIYANAIDRHLVSIGKPQRFGTQYSCDSGTCLLLPYDPTTTDEERAEYGISPLNEDPEEIQ